MIEKLLGTSTKVSAARVLVLNPERSFSLNKLASASGCSPSTLYQQLDDLVGVVAERAPEGIRVLRDSPIFVPLRRLFLVEKQLQAKRSVFEALSRLGRYYVTGSSGLYLRGLGRDFAPKIEKYPGASEGSRNRVVRFSPISRSRECGCSRIGCLLRILRRSKCSSRR